jgi:hypothetical protein
MVTVLPLGEQRNPYLKDYEPWDKWVYEHAVTSTDPAIERYFRGEGGRSNVVIDAYVDSSGFLVPQRMAKQRRLHAQAVGRDEQPVYLPQWTHVLFAAGSMDPALRESYEHAMLKLRAEYTVTIPDWLAANPPAWALVLPAEAGPHAGEVVMYGRAGMNPDYVMCPGEIRPAASCELFYRYSPSGKLLGQTVLGQQWWELYTANPAAPAGPGSTSYYAVFEAAGLISVTDVRTGKLAWRMDYGGKRLAEQQRPAPRNENHWLGLTARELKAIYAIQHEAPAPKVAPKPRPKAKAAPPLGGSRH